ncbi:MAG: smc 2 [Chthonomonadaceae bacterium]|nr:smc 2 [Chthonomonadaceae bacterium]
MLPGEGKFTMSESTRRRHYLSSFAILLVLTMPFATRLPAEQGDGTAGTKKDAVARPKSLDDASPVPAAPEQPSPADQAEFVLQYSALVGNLKPTKPEDIDLDKFDAAKEFSDKFAQMLTDTKDAALAARLAAIYKQVSLAKAHRDRLTLAVAEAKAINAPLKKLTQLWASFKPFADHDFKDIKDPAKGLVDALKAYNNLDTDRLTAFAGNAGDIATAFDKSLNDSHQSLVDAVESAVKGFDRLSVLPEDASDAVLRSALESSMAPLASAITAATAGKKTFGKIESAYTDAGLPAPTTTIEYATIQGPVQKVLVLLRKRLSITASDMVKEAEAAQRTLDQVVTDPFKEHAPAAAYVHTAKPIVESARNILKAAGDVRDALGNTNIPDDLKPAGFRLSEIEDQIKSMSLATERLDVVTLMLQEPNPINIEQWEGQYVNLYYFDDVPRLMNVLVGDDPTTGAKQIGGDPTARAAADTQRTALVTKIEDLSQKRADLNNARAAYEKRRIELNQTLDDKKKQFVTAVADYNREETNAKRADDAWRALDLRSALDTKERDRIGALRTAAATERDTAKSALDMDPSNKNKQEAERRARADFNRLDTQYNDLDLRTTVDQKALDKATADKTAAATKRDTAKTKKEQLETEINTAQSALDDSKGELQTLQNAIDTQNSSVSTAMRDMYVQALAENAAFANARDNQPFWRSRPPTTLATIDNADLVQRADLTDPVRRVFLFGFPDSKTIFIRGRASDVKQVREIIASFDRPQAQALMTLWSIELSSQSTREGSDRVSKQIRVIEDELRISRAQTDASLTLMRKAINETVNSSLNTPCRCNKCNLVKAGTALRSPGMQAAISFYDAEVFQELHLLDKDGNLNNQPDSILEALLPDPRGTTTLAEALVVLSLAKTCHRQAVIAYFVSHIAQALNTATADALGQDIVCLKHCPHPDCVTCASGAPCPVHCPQATCLTCSRVQTQVARRMPRIPGFGALRRYCGDTGDGAWLHSFRQEVIVQLLAQGGREIRLAAGRAMQRIATRTVQVGRTEKQAITAARERDTEEGTLLQSRRTSQVEERCKDLSEAEKLLIWAQTRPTPSELRSKFSDADGRFAALIKKAEGAYIAQSSNSSSEKEYQKATAQKDQLLLKAAMVELGGLTDTPTHGDLRASKIRELSELRDVTGLAQALTDKDKAQHLSQIAQTRPSDMSRQLREKLLHAPTMHLDAVKAASNSPDFVQAQGIVADASSRIDTNNVTVKAFNVGSVAYDDWAREQLDAIRNFRSGSQFDFDNAREAAANETVKRALKAVDEDLQHMFIDPMLDRVRADISVDGVSVGVFQRTQIIASNRLVAKVDPTASSTLNLAGQETNALQEVLQLTQFVAQIQTGGALTALGGLQKSAAQEKQTPPSFYGITSGNTFRVTPVLDPTGQALRFRFDHVLRTAVREPNGTVNSQLNRIEQTGVNTEVQLSNNEIGLISRFQTNQKLGQPTVKSGGIPVLKNIPILNEIPIIGWFSRRNYRAAVVQQSLLLGQTAIFPTIGDVIHLLTKPMPDFQPAGMP